MPKPSVQARDMLNPIGPSPRCHGFRYTSLYAIRVSPELDLATPYIVTRLFHFRFNRLKNSSLVFALDRMHPSIQLVVVVALVF